MCLTKARQREMVLGILGEKGAVYWDVLQRYEQKKKDEEEICQEVPLVSLIDSMVRNNDLAYEGNKLVVARANRKG